MDDQATAPITALLRRWRAGDSDATGNLLPLIYGQLRAVARHQLGHGRAANTLTPTEPVHEAYLKRSSGKAPDSLDCAHFFAIAARAMRQILVDDERQRRAGKREGGERVSLSSADPPDPRQSLDLLALDQALDMAVPDRVA